MPSVREVMSKDLVTVDRSATVEEASTIMWARHVGSALIMQGEDLEGIFTERDIMQAISKNADRGRTMTVREFMTLEPRTIDADATVGKALDVMLTHGFRHLPVTEGGGLVGIVSMTDLVQATSKRATE